MTYFFIHTPKTSGTTFVDVLSKDSKNNIGYFYPPKREMTDFERQVKESPYYHLEKNPDFEKYNFIVGHFTFGIHEILNVQEFRYIGVLREPVSHYVSLYKALMRMPSPYRKYIFNGYAEQTIHSFLELDLTHNLQTFFLSGLSKNEIRQDKDRALSICEANFNHHFDGFIITERFDESLQLLALKNLVQPQFYKRRNVATNSLGTHLTPELIERIRSVNDVDMQLHEIVMKRFRDDFREHGSLGVRTSMFKLGNVISNVLTEL